MWAYWLFIAIEALIMHTLLPIDALAMPESAYVTIIGVNSMLLVLVLISRFRNDRDSAMLLLGGFLLRLVLMFWSEYCSHIFTLPNSGADELTYYYNAMSNMVKDKTFTGYAQFFAWQANIYGLSKIYGKFINVLMSVTAIMILRRILTLLDTDHRIMVRTLAFACFLPNFAIVSSLLLRESMIILLVAVCVCSFTLWWKYNRWFDLLLSVAAAFGAAWFHSGMVACILAILSIAVASRRTPQGRSYCLTSLHTLLLTVVTCIVVFALLMNTNLGITSYFRGADSVADIVSISDAYEDGGSAYNANIVSNESTVGFLINTPFRMLYFIFAPMPWDWRNATDIIAFAFSGLFYGYVFFKVLPQALKGKRHSVVAALFVVYLLLLLMFGWGVSNSGTALRHRDKMVILALTLSAVVDQGKLTDRATHNRRRSYEV